MSVVTHPDHSPARQRRITGGAAHPTDDDTVKDPDDRNLLRVRDQLRVNRSSAAEHAIEGLSLRRREPARSRRRRRNRSRMRAYCKSADKNRDARCDQRTESHGERPYVAPVRELCGRRSEPISATRRAEIAAARRAADDRETELPAASRSAVSSDALRLRLTDATVTIQQPFSSRSTSSAYPSGVVPCQTLITIYHSAASAIVTAPALGPRLDGGEPIRSCPPAARETCSNVSA